MDSAQYQQYKRGEVRVIFICKNCTEETGREYTGHVDIFKPASSNASIEYDSVDETPVLDALEEYMTPPRPKLVDYSLTSEESWVSRIFCQ